MKAPDKNLALHLVCFLGSAFLAVRQEWSVREFCWSVWIAGLVFSLLCVAWGYIHLIIRVEREGRKLANFSGFALLSNPLNASLVVFAAGSVAAMAAAFIYLKVFSFYGLFLSVFAEMKPYELFGRNGFINSDFFTPAAHLARKFWPVILLASVSGAGALTGPDPWVKMVMPVRSKEIIRIHLMTLALPFLSLFFWMIFRDKYNAPAVVSLLAIFFLVSLPSRRPARTDGGAQPPSHPEI